MAKHKTKKQAKGRGKPLKRGFPRFLWLAIGLGIIAVAAIVFARTSPTSGPAVSTHSGELKCAIVDQLYNIRENQAFIEETTQELRDYGFEVDVYQGDADH